MTLHPEITNKRRRKVLPKPISSDSENDCERLKDKERRKTMWVRYEPLATLNEPAIKSRTRRATAQRTK